MKRVALIAAAVTVLSFAGAPQAHAQTTCKYIPSMCPAQPPGQGGPGGGGSGPVSVPEPATLALLGGGVAALGLAVIRRRKRD